MPKTRPTINRCIFRDPILSICSGAFKPDVCHYVNNPAACFDYEETERMKPSVTTPAPDNILAEFSPPPTIKRKTEEDTESLMAFSERMEKELQEMGIKVVREPVIPPKPDGVCPVCHWAMVTSQRQAKWWWREPSAIGGKGEWVCGVCHPQPVATVVEKEAPEWF